LASLRFVILIAAILACHKSPAAAQDGFAGSALRDRSLKLHEKWTGQAEQLADKLDADGESAGAEAVRKLIRPAATGVISIPILPTTGPGTTAAPGNSAEKKPEWQLALARIRKQHARELYELAPAAFRAGDATLCYDVMREVIEHDPDHGPARGLMGFTRYGKDWVTPFAAGKLRAGQIWHATYGWVPKSHVAHYEKGEQLWKGQWLPAAEVAKFRQQWGNAWEVETDHYIVRTNTSLERAVQFADKLEKLHAVFFRLFADFFSPREQLAVLFEPANRRKPAGKAADADRRAAKKFRVHFYRTREEYIDALRPYVKSGLDASTGMYLTGTKIAYFFADQRMDESTVVHEATHQLFSESRESRQGDGSRGNYWVMEGIACYMESFRDRGDHVELGAWDTPRLKRGRDWIMAGKLVPIDKLARMETKDFDGPEVFSLYTQSACLSHFLMHHDQGRLRGTLVNYLEQVYMGKADFDTLSELTELRYDEMDRLFREHVVGAKYE